MWVDGNQDVGAVTTAVTFEAKTRLARNPRRLSRKVEAEGRERRRQDASPGARVAPHDIGRIGSLRSRACTRTFYPGHPVPTLRVARCTLSDTGRPRAARGQCAPWPSSEKALIEAPVSRCLVCGGPDSCCWSGGAKLRWHWRWRRGADPRPSLPWSLANDTRRRAWSGGWPGFSSPSTVTAPTVEAVAMKINGNLWAVMVPVRPCRCKRAAFPTPHLAPGSQEANDEEACAPHAAIPG